MTEWLTTWWVEALGWGGSALLVYSLLQTRVFRLRVLNLVACLVLVVFNALVDVWPMVAMNVALCVINGWFIARMWRERHDDATFAVLQVRPDDAWLTHVLGVHRDDIDHFQPGLSWDPQDPQQRAFLVVRRDETVGIVLARDVAGVAQVQLDWVTPRYRDFSPGEFVWRQSTLLQEQGFHRIVSPRGMIGPYYDRLGFRREGDVFVLDL